MNKQDLEHFKKKLLEEKASLEQQLSRIGRKDAHAAGGWDATSGTIEVDTADENEVADKLEELEENTGVVSQLENQLSQVKNALDRIENGSYGACSICNKPIERERLEANPSASISIKHAHEIPQSTV